MLPATLTITGAAPRRHPVDPAVTVDDCTLDGRAARLSKRIGPPVGPARLQARLASRKARRGPGWLEVLAVCEAEDESPWLLLEHGDGLDLHRWFEACILDPGATQPALAVHVVAGIARALHPCYADDTAIPGALVREALIRPDGGVAIGCAGALTDNDTPTANQQIRHLLDLLRHLAGPLRPRAIDVLRIEVGNGASLAQFADSLEALKERVAELASGELAVADLTTRLAPSGRTGSSTDPTANPTHGGRTEETTHAPRHPDLPTLSQSLSIEETSLQETVVGGRYKLLRVIGTGAMGYVYEATRIADGEHVAVKVMKSEGLDGPALEEYVARFRREADLLARLQHPHIVEVHAFGTRGGCWMAMELVRGHSLVQLLDPGEPLPLHLALTITKQVALALQHAHSLGIVHRDVKPGNLLVASHDPVHIKLCDFGLAKAWDHEDRTVQGALIGTPQYMSPEQARGEPAGVRADLYGMGILLYRLVTGSTPFSNHPGASVLVAHTHQDPIPMAEANPRVEVPSIVQDVVDRCLAKTRDDRYGSADWLLDDLERCLARMASPGDPTPALSVPYRELTSEEALDPRPIRPRPAPPLRPAVGADPRLQWVAMGMAAVLLVWMVGMAVWWVWGAPPAPAIAPSTQESSRP